MNRCSASCLYMFLFVSIYFDTSSFYVSLVRSLQCACQKRCPLKRHQEFPEGSYCNIANPQHPKHSKHSTKSKSKSKPTIFTFYILFSCFYFIFLFMPMYSYSRSPIPRLPASPNTLPHNASHTVGVGAVVTNSEAQVPQISGC